MRLSQFKAIFTNALADYLALDIDPALRVITRTSGGGDDEITPRSSSLSRSKKIWPF